MRVCEVIADPITLKAVARLAVCRVEGILLATRRGLGLATVGGTMTGIAGAGEGAGEWAGAGVA